MRRDLSLYIPLAATLIIIWVVAIYELESIWAFSHVKYLGEMVWYFLGALTAAVLLMVVVPWPDKLFEHGEKAVAGWLWNGSILPKALLSGGFAGLFYLFKVPVPFLGDGFFLLDIFSHDQAYAANLVKPLSIWAVKAIQTLSGGYTYWSALYTFETISIVSGFFVIYNFGVIAGRLTESDRGRLFAFGTMICSGWLQLFFGYIEYYPMLWLAASFFIRQAIKCAQGDASRWTVWLTFLVTIGVHMQAFCLLPGVLYIQFSEQLSDLVSRMSILARRVTTTIGLLIPVGVVLAADMSLSSNSNPFLHILPIDRDIPDYTVFSLGNLLETANLIFLLVPTVLVVLGIIVRCGSRPTDRTSNLLGLLALGALYFLVLINPKLGLARDWDLMSLTLFSPLLFLLYRVRDWSRLSVPPLVATVILSACVTFSYLSTNCRTEPSEQRFFDLLQHYGAKERGGWVMFTRYLEQVGKNEFLSEVTTQLAVVLPEQTKLQTAVTLMERGDLDEAEVLVQELIRHNPEHGQYRASLGDIRVRQGRIDEAITMYLSSLKTHPNHRNYYCLGSSYLLNGDAPNAIKYLSLANQLAPQQEEVLAGLCRTYASVGQLAMAKKYADVLLAINPKAPDGLIIALVVASRSGDSDLARQNYRKFLQHGRRHPQYEEIKQSFAPLVR